MDLDALLSDTGRVTTGDQALARGRAALDEAARTSATVVALKRRQHRRVTLAGLVAAAAAAVVFAPTVGYRSAPVAKADAAQVLLRAGASAGAQQGDWQGAAYWHSVSRYSQDGRTHTREIWIGHRRPGVLLDPGVQAGTVIPLEVAAFPAGSRAIAWDELWTLPTDPARLERELRAGIRGAGNGDDAELFVIVGDLLRESPAPPALRQALWEVAAMIPGVELVGTVTDGAGRTGTAVERYGQRYVLDPDTGRLLEESSGGWQATYLEQGPTETAPAATHDERKLKPAQG